MTATATVRALSFRALDYRFDVSGEDAAVLQRVADCYRDIAVDDHGPMAAAQYEILRGSADGMHRLVCDGAPVFTDTTAAHLLGTVLWHVNAQATQRPVPGHVVLHASAATRAGRAVVLAAPMESGKTTTVAGLVQAGFGYLTDEAAAVSLDDLHVEPFHKSLAVDTGSWGVLDDLRPYDVGGMPAQWQVPVGGLPDSKLADRTPLGWVVLPRYLAGAETALEPVSRATAVMDLAASTFQFLEAPEASLSGLGHIARHVDCYRLTIGSLDAAVAVLDDLMSPA